METRVEKYDKRPTTVEAVRLTEENRPAVQDWIHGTACNKSKALTKLVERGISIMMYDVPTTVCFGEWVVRDQNGWFHGLSDRIFKRDHTPWAPMWRG